MPKEQKRAILPRQPPVSCRFCRSRKLRCDRKSPCSSCVSRNIICELEKSSDEAVTPAPSDTNALARLQRLEELLTAQSQQHHFHTKALYLERNTVLQHGGTGTLTPELKGLDQDVAWLESIYQYRLPLDKEQTGQFKFQIISIKNLEHILRSDTATASDIVGLGQIKRILLPTQHEAKVILDKYIEDIDFIHHIVHIPSLIAAIDEIYASLAQSGQANPGHIILLLSILGSSTYSWTDMDVKRDLFDSPAEAHSQSSFWIRSAQEVIDTVHRSTVSSIEAVQGAIIVAFIAVHHEDVSASFHSILSIALQMARTVGLHRLDHPSATGILSPVQTEVGRRVWWYLVASDWFLACKFGGTTEGSYDCHARHMITKKPLNLDDEDLKDGIVPVEKPMSMPTSMSYSLQRIRMSEICRQFVDCEPLVMSGTASENYDNVLDFDTAIQTFINDLPAFFSMSLPEVTSLFQVDHAKATRLVTHGHIIHHMIYSLRCKLHVPYLMRGYADHKYGPSRQICIETARLIIQSEVAHERSGLLALNRYQFIRFVLGVFVASVVLLVELCIDKTTSRQSEYRQEIIDAFRLLEMAREQSRNAARFLDSLLSVLHKHQVAPPNKDSRQVNHPQPALNSGQNSTTVQMVETNKINLTMPTPEGSATMSDMVPETSNLDASTDNAFGDDMDMSSYFDMLNQSLQQGSDMEFCDWDGLFSGLGSFI
ncbi:hypothetical protein MBLNU457_5537t1 [Dothideomycetes sp. NU457]